MGMDFTRATAHALDSLGSFWPELILCITILLVILTDLVAGRGRPQQDKAGTSRLPGWVAIAGLLASAVAAWLQMSAEPRAIFFGMLTADSQAAFFKLLFALSTVLIALISFRLRHQGELHALLLTAVLGMDLLAGSRNLLMVLLSLELVSVMSYVLAGFDRRDPRSGEAALKYMVFGSMASGVMAYGISLFFGLTGTLDLAGVKAALASGSADPLTLLLATLMVLTGIGYKIAMVPFHFWCPDVYEGAPTPITTFFSVGPKAAGLALLIRFLYPQLTTPALLPTVPLQSFDLLFLIALLSAFTMTLGNLAAIGQRQVTRLLAYSSIAHAGYLMMGVVLADINGIQAVLFYLIIYLFMNYGAFLLVDAVGQLTGDESIDAFKGLWRRHPGLAVAMTVFLVSLVGLPPLAGFIGKFVLFAAVIKARWYWLVSVAILNSVISLYAYFGVVRAMYLGEDDEAPTETGTLPATQAGVIAGLCALTILFGIYWEPLVRLASSAIARLL